MQIQIIENTQIQVIIRPVRLQCNGIKVRLSCDIKFSLLPGYDAFEVVVFRIPGILYYCRGYHMLCLFQPVLVIIYNGQVGIRSGQSGLLIYDCRECRLGLPVFAGSHQRNSLPVF